MRRSLTLTVAAAVTMVLLAMLVPMAVLLRSYALEDRLARAALEVQATEAVVSGQDPGAVSVYLDRVNGTDSGIATTVLYPDGKSVGPDPGEDVRVVESRLTGTARVDDVEGGSEILIPVSLGGSSGLPEETPVIRVFVEAPGLEPDLVRSWGILALLGVVLLVGALVLADRLGRSFVDPIGRLATHAGQLSERRRPEPITPDGPPEVRELATAMNRLVDRIEVLLERERAGIADVSHRLRTPMTSLRLGADALTDPEERARISADLDALEVMVDHVVREARRSEREGLVPDTDAVAALSERVRFWEPLAEDQARDLQLVVNVTGPIRVPASVEDLQALLDVLLGNVVTHTPEGAPVRVTLDPRDGGGLRLVVEDGGPGFAPGFVVDRGTSGAGSTGLGLSIADKTASESGGGLSVTGSSLGGARVVIDLGGA